MRVWRAAAGVALAIAGLSCGGDGGVADGSGPQVVAAFYPLAWVASEVGGDGVQVTNLTAPGAEPHDLELGSGDIRELASADLIVYVGEGFQPAVEEAVEDTDAPAIEVLSLQDDLLAEDPHIWLAPSRLTAVAREVATALAEVDPESANAYDDNAVALTRELTRLDADFETGLAECEQDSLVTSHEAFGYLADAYGLEQIGIAGIDPEGEPSPQRLAELTRFVEDEGITTIFFETLVSPEVAETLAAEAGVTTAELDPLESEPDSGDYLSVMRANLEALQAGLGCT